MFATLGDIIFEALTGFDAFSETDEAIIAQYPLIGTKPQPVTTASGLRKLNICVRLRQEFIIVKAARLQLRAYKDQGDVLTLSWGNGDVEGQFLIQAISMVAEVMDSLGNLISAGMVIDLVEVPAKLLYASKQASAQKAAFGNKVKNYPPVVFTRPAPHKKRGIDKFLGYIKIAIRLAALIDALSYGGKFPNLGSNLTSVITNAKYNLILLQQNYDAHGNEYALPDISGFISDTIDKLDILSGISPTLDSVAFLAANKVFQTSNKTMCF